jgi:S1-C subfamily serine protease
VRCHSLRRNRLTIVCALLIGAVCSSADARVKSGTGFFVSTDGYLVTSGHLVAGCPVLSTWTTDGKQHDTQLVALNRHLDIALLRLVAAPPFTAQVFSAAGEVPVGDRVHTIGYGVIAHNPREEVRTVGVYVGTTMIPSGIEVKVIRAPLREGQSGGPVIGSAGALLGMVIGRFSDAPDRGVVLPSTRINAFLRVHGINAPPPVMTDDRQTPSRELLPAATALVQCLPRTGAAL